MLWGNVLLAVPWVCYFPWHCVILAKCLWWGIVSFSISIPTDMYFSVYLLNRTWLLYMSKGLSFIPSFLQRLYWKCTKFSKCSLQPFKYVLRLWLIQNNREFIKQKLQRFSKRNKMSDYTSGKWSVLGAGLPKAIRET